MRGEANGGCGGDVAQVYTTGDRDELPRPSDAQRQVLRRLGVGERDDPVCPASSEPLQSDEDAGGCGGEVAAEDMTVGGMDDVWDVLQAGRQPTQEAGLGGVGMDDLRPLLPDLSAQRFQGAQISQRMDLATQGRDHRPLDVLLSEAAGDSRGWLDGPPGDESTGKLLRWHPRNRKNGVLGGAADIQPRDDVQNAGY